MATHPKGLTLDIIKQVNIRLMMTPADSISVYPTTIQYLLDIIAEQQTEIAEVKGKLQEEWNRQS